MHAVGGRQREPRHTPAAAISGRQRRGRLGNRNDRRKARENVKGRLLRESAQGRRKRNDRRPLRESAQGSRRKRNDRGRKPRGSANGSKRRLPRGGVKGSKRRPLRESAQGNRRNRNVGAIRRRAK
jgi:hypothetical protein